MPAMDIVPDEADEHPDAITIQSISTGRTGGASSKDTLIGSSTASARSVSFTPVSLLART